MLPLGIANSFALLSLTRICENGKLKFFYGPKKILNSQFSILNSNRYFCGLKERTIS